MKKIHQQDSYSCRDKIEMAWRHKSRDEKILLRIILFLCVALIAFITTVAILDTTYKHEIKDLKEEIRKLMEDRSTPSGTDITDDTDLTNIPTTFAPSTTTSLPSTTTLPTITEPAVTTTVSSSIPASSPENEAALLGSLLLNALQQILNMHDSNSTYPITEEFDNGRTKGKFVLIANLEQQHPIKTPHNVHPTTELSENNITQEPTSETPLTTIPSSSWSWGNPFGYQATTTQSTKANLQISEVSEVKTKRGPSELRKRKNGKKRNKNIGEI